MKYLNRKLVLSFFLSVLFISQIFANEGGKIGEGIMQFFLLFIFLLISFIFTIWMSIKKPYIALVSLVNMILFLVLFSNNTAPTFLSPILNLLVITQIGIICWGIIKSVQKKPENQDS